MTDASLIVAFHLALQRANPESQLLWWPATSGQQYMNNVELAGDVNRVVARITNTFPNAELIQLTLNDGMLYFK